MTDAKSQQVRRITLAQWQAEGRERYGDNVAMWKFKCPSCGFVQTGMDYKAYNTPLKNIDLRLAFSCIGRTIEDLGIGLPVVEFGEEHKGYGCNYAGGGLFRIAPTEVLFGIAKESGEDALRPVFDWADPAPIKEAKKPW